MKILSTPADITDYIDNQLITYYKKGTLYPFIGAGFTMGSKAKRALVPNGTECMDMMKKFIVSESEEYSDINEEKDFDQVANIFYNVVPKEVISDFIFDHFTSVTLEKVKKEFINLNWPYIYTLNIDDAIENNASYKAVFPNRKIVRKYLNTGMVFKLHGDAFEEVAYIKNSDGVVFSRSQYLKSINQNKDLLDIFLEDYTSQNILLIGCSLLNEIDIEYLIANDEFNPNKISDKIYVTTQEPKGLKKVRLLNFGINVCLVVDNYDGFYKNLVERLGDLKSWDTNPFQKYLIKKYSKNDNPDFNKEMIFGETELSIENNVVNIPDFFIERMKLTEALSLIQSEDIIFVIGKRVSGKTFFLHSIANSIKNKDVYFFPSNVTIDSDFIEKLIGLKNCVVIFDSDTIDPYDVEEIYYRISDFTAKGINFVFCVNSSDRLMLSIPMTKVIDREIIELESYFKEEEILLINKSLSKYAIPNFRKSNNLLSNIITYKEIYRNLDTDVSKIVSQFETKMLKVFILCAVFNKVYSSVFRALNIDHDNLSFAIQLSNKAIELEHDLDTIEFGQHASYKAITNSKAYIFACLGAYIERRENMNFTVSSIIDIVAKLKPHDRFHNIYKAVIAFDTLNQIFYKKGNGGAINLIFLIYEKLEALLYQDTHYWMQRAKSIFYLKRNNIGELLKAIEFAKKPYYDSEPFTRVNMNASYQIATIYLRVTNLQHFKDPNIFKEAVNWIYTTLQESTSDNKVIQNLVYNARKERDKNDLYNLAIHIKNNRQLVEKKEAEAILSKILTFKI